jgi:phosphoribosylaminoimidazolecarboxamide formyltransferase/IMP cyclohydrolase
VSRALLSVWDKTGLEELARGLLELGWELIASGGTSKALSQWGLAHLSVEEVTGDPEILGGRVKTLHPKVHGGILAVRDDPSHMADLQAQAITPIDLVVCNLYPFWEAPSVELIDIGGPAMVRAAAKNHEHVGVVVRPQDYGEVLEELRRGKALSLGLRRRLATIAFATTSSYDAMIANWLGSLEPDSPQERDSAPEHAPEALPERMVLALEAAQALHYGENPHQKGARYRVVGRETWWDRVRQHSGRALSYLNVFDTEAAWELAFELVGCCQWPMPEEFGQGGFASPIGSLSASPSDRGPCAAVVVKHASPCGAAVDVEIDRAIADALACDETSAFGGILAVTGIIDDHAAQVIAAGPQADVIVARGFTPEAIERLVARRKATRLLQAVPPDVPGLSVRSVGSGFLVQGPDLIKSMPTEWRVATKTSPSPSQWVDMAVAWVVCARTVSNAIVLVREGRAWGIGGGQPSRVDAAGIAVRKAADRARGGVAASDAFFPFRDGLEVLAEAGVTCVVQPGGSVRDQEIIEAAEAHGIAMVLTGERHFRH